MPVVSDLNRLVPAFRERVAALLLRLQAAGYKPRVHETWRSSARARRLVAQGKSKARGGLSMHCYGCAVDIICGEHEWACGEIDRDGKPKHPCGFYQAAGRESKAVGLVWGGDWDGDGDIKDQSLYDAPHHQAVPIGLQNKVRTMSAADLEAWLAARLAWD